MDPSIAAQTSLNGNFLRFAQLSLDRLDTEDDEMHELIQQLNSMKETLSKSHSSDPIEPPPSVRRQPSISSIFSDVDETEHRYIPFDDGFWLDKQSK
jgi:hypothetical protein